jgi:glutathione S-transferase
MLVAAGIQWDEAPYLTEKAQMEKLRNEGKLLFQQVPLLEWDGEDLVQGGAIARHIARKAGMDGKDIHEKLWVDMLTEGARDFAFPFLGFGMKEDDSGPLKNVKEKVIPRYAPVFERRLEKNGEFLVGKSLTLADVALFEALLNMEERTPEDLDKYPKLKAFCGRMHANPRFDAYLKSDKRTAMGHLEYYATVGKVLDMKF